MGIPGWVESVHKDTIVETEMLVGGTCYRVVGTEDAITYRNANYEVHLMALFWFDGQLPFDKLLM
jgi:hypothetical protein